MMLQPMDMLGNGEGRPWTSHGRSTARAATARAGVRGDPGAKDLLGGPHSRSSPQASPVPNKPDERSPPPRDRFASLASSRAPSQTGRDQSPSPGATHQMYSSQKLSPSRGAAMSARGRGHEAGEAEPGPSNGSYYQFNLKGPMHSLGRNSAKGTKHLDVMLNTHCLWDQGDESLDSSNVLNPNTQFHRMYYTWALKQRGSSGGVKLEEATWLQFRTSEKVSVEEFNEWVCSLRPRSVHDYKPLLVLLQGAFKQVMQREIAFYSTQAQTEIRGLQERLAEALAVIAAAEKEKTVATKAAMKANWGKLQTKVKVEREKKSIIMATAAKMEGWERKLQHSSTSLREQQHLHVKRVQQDLEAEVDRLKGELAAAKQRVAEVQEKAQEEAATRVRRLTEELQQEKTKASKARKVSSDAECQTSDTMDELTSLFAADGAWQFVSDMAEMRNLVRLAQGSVSSKYGVRCEVSRVTYSTELDPDGDGADDPDTYDDNMMEVVVDSQLGRRAGELIPRAEAGLLYKCANARAVEEDVDQMVLPIVTRRAAPTARWPDGHPRGDTWGVIAVEGGSHAARQALAAPLQLWAAGMSRVMNQLQDEYEKALVNTVDQVHKIVTEEAKNRWTTPHHRKFRDAGRRIMEQNWQEKEKEEGTVSIAMLAAEERARVRDVENLRSAHEVLVHLQRARNKVNSLLEDESTRNLLSQQLYLVPEPSTVDIFVALLTTLGHTATWRQVCKEGNDLIFSVPKGKHEEAWNTVSQSLNVDTLIKGMLSLEPMTNVADGPYAELEEQPKPPGSTAKAPVVNITAKRNQTVNKVLDSVPTKEALKVSLALGIVQEWSRVVMAMTNTLQQQRLLQEKLGFPRLENSCFVSGQDDEL